MLAMPADRVVRHTPKSLNERIRSQTETRVRELSAHPERIPARLASLDREWDVERALETGSSMLSLIGLGLAVTVSPWWLLLTAGVQLFFLQHALQGWCPPLPIFRALGFRTCGEIDAERFALRSLVSPNHGAAT